MLLLIFGVLECICMCLCIFEENSSSCKGGSFFSSFNGEKDLI